MILYLIPARKGSKGVPDKNLLRLTEGGSPLVRRAWHLTGKCRTGLIRVTTDYTNDEMGFSDWNNSIRQRRPELCRDDTPMIDVVRDALEEMLFDIVVLLQPSCPFRRPEDIDAAIGKVQDGAKTCISVVKTTHAHPAYQLTADGKWAFPPLDPFSNRQDLPTYYTRVGAFYVARADHIRDGGDWYTEDQAFVEVPWYSGINIDTPEDVIIAKAVAQELGL